MPQICSDLMKISTQQEKKKVAPRISRHKEIQARKVQENHTSVYHNKVAENP